MSKKLKKTTVIKAAAIVGCKPFNLPYLVTILRTKVNDDLDTVVEELRTMVAWPEMYGSLFCSQVREGIR
jgi:hypothetical protein